MTLFPGGYFTQAKNDKKAKKAYEQNSHENCMAAIPILFAGYIFEVVLNQVVYMMGS